jgi:hypothetical protein
MPLDSQGQFRHNHESADMHSKAAGKSYTPKAKEPMEDDGAKDGATEVHNHGDGTFHTVHEGEKTEHESIGHMHAHLSKIHGEDGHSHFHAHHDGMMHTSHSAKSGEEPEHREHDGIDGVHEHLHEALGVSQEEPDGEEQEPAMQGKGLAGLGY